MNTPSPLSDPHAEYAQRLQQRRATVARLEQAALRVSNARLFVFLLGAGLGWFAIRSGLLSSHWLLVPVAVFVILIFYHERVRVLLRAAKRGVVFYERGVARLEDRWGGHGTQGGEFLPADHPYAQDLDLFGPDSLFELLCTARTRGGEAALASWLCAPAAPAEVRARHVAVDELRPKIDLRERLALSGEDVRAEVHPDTLRRWAEAPPHSPSPWLRPVAAGLVVCTGAALVAWLTGNGHPAVVLAALAVQGGFALVLRPHVLPVIAGVAQAKRDLAVLAPMLDCLERERFTGPRLVALRAALEAEGAPPSRQLARLDRLVTLLESRQNQFFIPFAAVLLWATQIALAIEAWRAASGPAVARWLQALGEFEALSALASYAYERPHDPFPELVEHGPVFEGEGVGHPLIPLARGVRNDVRLGDPLRVLLVSGSNMSGKSTLLRTVGANTVLALAGAPVRARRLRLSPLAVGATLRVQDSLQAGSSRFYAEITRLRLLMDLAKGPLPLLFLLDEILHGTNSHDRRIGAEAVVRGLVDCGAVGLVTTHDLALVHIADALAPRAANVCFEDHLVDGRLAFDYRMRRGVVTKSNALALMRSVGLEV